MKNKHFNARALVLASLCVALGVVLPAVMHGIPNAGRVILPMHFPVLLSGLICGPFYGLLCGILTPALSSLITGMPPAAVLPSMICELAAYGLIAGLLRSRVHTGKRAADLYIQLICAMLLGRAVYGLMNALVFSAGGYTFSAFISAAFITCLPGIIIQLILVPAVVLALEKAGVIRKPE